MPEHFIALVKQFGNFSSIEEARRAAKDISSSLLLMLSDDQCKLFLAYTPKYLHIKPNLFRETIKKLSREYKHEAFIDRIRLLEGLTDEIEVYSHLKAYFNAIEVVVGEKQYSNLYSIMPQRIQEII